MGTIHTEENREHMLACLSSAPSNAKIIRTAARMAQAFQCPFTALFVETPDYAVATAENKQRLQANCDLAKQLGAKIEIVFGDDIAYQIAEFARLSGVTKIVLGRSAVARRTVFGKPSLTEQLLTYASEIDIHVIPDRSTEQIYHPRRVSTSDPIKVLINVAKITGILLGATVLSSLLERLGFTDANIIMIYILGVLLTSIVTSHRIYSLAAAVASVFVFNYLFTKPRFSLTAYETGYPLTFVIMFFTAYITGTLAIRYKEQAAQSARVAYRTKVLLDTVQLLSKARTREDIQQVAAGQIGQLLQRDVFLPEMTPEGTPLPACQYFPLRVNDRCYGSVGIAMEKGALEAFEHSILQSILGECALALENEQNAREKKEAAIRAENEQLRANLLRAISHDLRTPLTTISGNASNLLSNGEHLDEETKEQLYRDIYTDSLWLINLVENLLYSTRIEDGAMSLHTSTELLDDIIEAAVGHVGRNLTTHPISVVQGPELLLVNVDARLITQVIINILDNAVKYTLPGSQISISAKGVGDWVEIYIADTGGGIPEEEKTKVFDKFYCGTGRVADGRRSQGLGLFLCKTIVEAHGGVITVADNQPHGTIFCFTLPREEVVLHEQNVCLSGGG